MKKSLNIVATVTLVLAAALSFEPTVHTPAPAPAIVVPEVSTDDYYRTGDVFQAEGGDLSMVGTRGTLQPDVDWTIVEGGTYPEGYYVLDADGALTPATESEVTTK